MPPGFVWFSMCSMSVGGVPAERLNTVPHKNLGKPARQLHAAARSALQAVQRTTDILQALSKHLLMAQH